MFEGYRKRTFKTLYVSPYELWVAACEYFEWCDANPLQSEKIFQNKGALIYGSEDKMRAYTIRGLQSFLGITGHALSRYRDSPQFADVMERIDNIIYTQKFEGAAAGLLNAGLITRDLGLSEKTEVSGPGGSAVPVTFNITPITSGTFLPPPDQPE